jgi:glycosyltransferase involved in cell wall biosynthesis
MTKTKVCITTLEYPPDVGGVGESVHRIATMLTQEGYEVHVAVFRSKQRFIKDKSRRRADCKTTLQENIFVHRIQSAVREASPEIQDFFSDVYFQLNQLHQRHQFDLFHAFFMNETGFVTTLLAKELDVPVVNSVRGSDLHKHIFNPKTHAQTSWILENSDWVTFVSQDLHRRAQRICPAIAPRSSIFWNSIAPIDFTQFPRPLMADQLSGVVIGSIGRLRDKKGIEFLLDACKSLESELDFTLLLIGDFIERERHYWQQEILHCGLGNRLNLTGLVSHEEVLGYLPLLDIFTIPSLHDGCPNALLEAMLAERAIIGTSVDAIGEILNDGVNGLVIPPGDSSALADAIRRLATQPQLRQQLGQAAKQTAQQQLSPAVEFENWQRVYQQALGQEWRSSQSVHDEYRVLVSPQPLL